MPELPEVETARRTLEPHLAERRIRRLEVFRRPALRSHTPAQAQRILAGQTIAGVGRRGKALIVELDRGWRLVFHYSLWGLVRVTPDFRPDAATAAALRLDDGGVVEFRELQLSNLNLYSDAAFEGAPYLAALGPDPLAREVTAARFRKRLEGRGAIRTLLTDQTRLAGIGNLWAHEILFKAGLRPGRNARDLSDGDWRRLYRAMRTVLRRAIRVGGEPGFVDADGRPGRYPLAVYGRDGQPCRACGGTIVATRVGGRPSFHCPRCQR